MAISLVEAFRAIAAAHRRPNGSSSWKAQHVAGGSWGVTSAGVIPQTKMLRALREVRVAAPSPLGPSCTRERDRDAEPKCVDCVRIVHKHKAVNVLNKLPKSLQANARQDLREIWLAPDRATAEAALATFAAKYAPKYDRAVAGLVKDREALLAFYDFPAEHWGHLRSSNPIESVFATVRHRTMRTKDLCPRRPRG